MKDKTPFDPPLHIEAKGGQEIMTVQQWGRLAPPAGKTHWKDGRSAKESARAWVGRSNGPKPPEEMVLLLRSRPETSKMRFGLVQPEARLKLDDFGGNTRNSDVLAHGYANGGSTLVAIEAKADESFGRPIEKAMTSPNLSKKSRLPDRVRALSRLIFNRELNATLGRLHYQLLHGLAGAVREAGRKDADQVVFVVHEFTAKANSKRLEANQHALDDFIAVLGAGPTENGQLVALKLARVQIPVFAGKCVWAR